MIDIDKMFGKALSEHVTTRIILTDKYIIEIDQPDPNDRFELYSARLCPLNDLCSIVTGNGESEKEALDDMKAVFIKKGKEVLEMFNLKEVAE